MVVQDDYYGNKSILGKIDIGNLSGNPLPARNKNASVRSVITTTEKRTAIYRLSGLAVPCAKGVRISQQAHSEYAEYLGPRIHMKGNIALRRKLNSPQNAPPIEKLMAYLSSGPKCKTALLHSHLTNRNSRTIFPSSARHVSRAFRKTQGMTAF